MVVDERLGDRFTWLYYTDLGYGAVGPVEVSWEGGVRALVEGGEDFVWVHLNNTHREGITLKPWTLLVSWHPAPDMMAFMK